MVFQSYVVYIGTVLLASILAYFETKAKPRISKALLVLIIILLTIVCGFRSISVGRDSAGYAYNYENQIFDWYEPGFTLLQKGLYHLSGDYSFLFTVIAFFTNLFFIVRLHDFQRDGASFSWCVFFYTAMSFTVGFNGMRQWLAVSLCFFATRYLYNSEKPRLFPFFLYMVIGVSMHYSAAATLVFLIPLIIQKQNNPKVKLIRIASLIIVIAGVFVGAQLFKARNYSPFLVSTGFEFGYMLVAKVLVIIMIILNKERRPRHSNDPSDINIKAVYFSYEWLVITECFYIVLSSLSYGFDVLGRIAWYFEPFETVFFANQYSNRRRTITMLAAKFLIFIIVIAKFIGNFSIIEKRFPYTFFWQ